MTLKYEASCFCGTRNKDNSNGVNFLFGDRSLEENNNGMRHAVKLFGSFEELPLFLSVFEAHTGNVPDAETASKIAKIAKEASKKLKQFVIPERSFLEHMTNEAIEVIPETSNAEIGSLLFTGELVYLCCSGNICAYRMRKNTFQQLFPVETMKKKMYIANGEIQSGDVYLLCSNAVLTGLENVELDVIIRTSNDIGEIVKKIADTVTGKNKCDVCAIIVRITS